MTKRITTSAGSPLGHWIALAGITFVLLYVGLFLATDGDIDAKLQGYVSSVTANKNVQQAQKALFAAFSDRFKKYDHPQQITYYGVAIVAGFLLAGLIGAFIRSYRFRFDPARGIVERQAMWLFVPVWLLAWIALAVLIVLIVGTSRGLVIHVPLSFLITLLVPAATWAWFADWAWDKVLLPFKGWPVRLYKWVLVWVGMALLILVARMVIRRDMMVPLPVPLWVVLALVLPPAVVVPGLLFLPGVARRSLFVPGLRKRVPVSRIKRMEVQSRAEGGTALVLTFADEGAWTISTAAPRRLQRLGRVLGRMLGLERRDLVTWS